MAPIPLRLRRAAAAEPNNAPVDLSELVAQLGGEVARTLTGALDRVNALAQSGYIDRSGLAALRAEIDQARRIGMLGQQLSRLASGGVRQAPEPMDLTAMLRDALLQRRHEMDERGIELGQRLRPACVVGDATLTFSLLQAVLDWAFEHTRSRIELELLQRGWPERVALLCRFDFRAVDELPDISGGVMAEHGLDSMSWRLLHQTAAALGLAVERHEAAGRTTLAIDFPRSLPAAPATLSEPMDLQPPLAWTLGGSRVLVVAARREVRNLVREALHRTGTMLDFVTSVDEARAFCRASPPAAIVHESALGGESFEQLRAELLAQRPQVAFVQIVEDGQGFELRRSGTRQTATVARAAVVDSLASALLFEMARAG